MREDVRKYIRKVIKEVFNNDKKRNIVVLVGPPSIGKSTWIKNNFKDAYIISRDDIVDSVAKSYGWSYDDIYAIPSDYEKIGDYNEKYGEVLKSPEGHRFSETVYSKVQEANKKVSELLSKRINKAHPSGMDIVVDMTNMNKFARENALSFIDGHTDEYNKIAVDFKFKGAEELVKKLSKKRELENKKKGIFKTIPDYAYDRMYASYEPPTKEEGFDEIISVDNISVIKDLLDKEELSLVSEHINNVVRRIIVESELFINEIDRVNVDLNTISKEDGFEIKALVDGEEAGSIYVVEKYDAFSDFEDYLTDEQYDTIFKENDWFFEIQNLEVKDNFKGEGIAGFLMNEAISKIKESGADIVYLNASPMGFTGLNISDLVKFYEKFGFRVIPQLDNYSENKEMILYL